MNEKNDNSEHTDPFNTEEASALSPHDKSNDFTALLSLKRESDNQFSNTKHNENFQKTIYGGQVLAQALIAASHTVDNIPIHSLHAYFLNAGQSDKAIHYGVERLRDGKSIASRRIVATQDSRPIFHMSASFHKPEHGYQHQSTHPNVSSAEELEANSSLKSHPKNIILQAFELRPMEKDPFGTCKQQKPEAYFWLRALAPLPKKSHLHKAALAYISDAGLLSTALFPHPTHLFSNEVFGASIDHAMWFHEDTFDINEWILCEISSPWAGHARGFAQASFYQSGTLIASCSQEGIIRRVQSSATLK